MQHLIVDMYDCIAKSLVERSYLATTFGSIPALVDMVQVRPLTIYEWRSLVREGRAGSCQEEAV